MVDRYFATARHYDAAVLVSSWDSPTKAQLLAIPGVERADIGAYIALEPRDREKWTGYGYRRVRPELLGGGSHVGGACGSGA